MTGLPITDEPDYVELAAPDYANMCHHTRAIVDEDKRTLTCRQCGAGLDPLTFIAARAKGLLRRHAEAVRIAELRDEMTTHAIGRDGAPTRCGISLGMKFTITVTNRVTRVQCRRCRAKLETEGLLYTHFGGEEVLL